MQIYIYLGKENKHIKKDTYTENQPAITEKVEFGND